MSDERDVFRMTKEPGLRPRDLRKRARLARSEQGARSPLRVLAGSHPLSTTAGCQLVTGHSCQRSGGLDRQLRRK